MQLAFNVLAWAIVAYLVFKTDEYWKIDSRNMYIQIETLKKEMELHHGRDDD